MDLQFTPDEEAFRLKVRGWLDENMPTSGLSTDREGRDDKTWLTRAKAWQRRLHEAGYTTLARRTVTKYRKMLHIPSSRQRKDWTVENAVPVSAAGVEEEE